MSGAAMINEANVRTLRKRFI